MTVTAPARVHGVSVQTARAPSSVPPVPSPAGKTAPGGKTAAVIRVAVGSARGGVSHLCSAGGDAAVFVPAPSAPRARRARTRAAAGSRRPPLRGGSPEFAPDRCTGRPAAVPLRRAARATSRKAPRSSRTACSPRPSARSLPALSDSPTPAKPLGEPKPAPPSDPRAPRDVAGAPEGNVGACGARVKAAQRVPLGQGTALARGACGCGGDGWRTRTRERRQRVCQRGCQLVRERERERRGKCGKCGEARRAKTAGEARRRHSGCAPPGAKLRPCTASTAGSPETA